MVSPGADSNVTTATLPRPTGGPTRTFGRPGVRRRRVVAVDVFGAFDGIALADAVGLSAQVEARRAPWAT